MIKAKITFTFLFLILLFNLVLSRPYFSIGVNQSSFKTENVTNKIGYSATIGQDWNIYKPIGFCIEASMSKRNCTLRNKTIGPGDLDFVPPSYEVVHLVDIDVSLLNLDIPILIRYRFKSNIFEFVVKGGYGITINLSNNINGKTTGKINTPPNFTFDYRGRRFNEDYDYGGFVSSHLGFGMIYKTYFIELKYLGTDIYSCGTFHLGGEKLYSLILNIGKSL